MTIDAFTFFGEASFVQYKNYNNEVASEECSTI